MNIFISYINNFMSCRENFTRAFLVFREGCITLRDLHVTALRAALLTSP